MSEIKEKVSFITNEEEIIALKSVFAGEDDLLIAIRGLLFGFPVEKGQKLVIATVFKDEKVREAFRKKLYPILAANSLIGQGGDFWYGTDAEIIGRDPDTIKQVVESKLQVLKKLEHALKLLENPDSTPMSLSFRFVDADPFQIDLLARNKYVASVDRAISMVKSIAGQKAESAEAAKKRLFGNSNK